MSVLTLSVKSQDNNGVTYADPAKPDCTVRFRFGSTTKVLNGIPTPNLTTEIIVNDNNDVTVGGVSAVDALSIRCRISGCAASVERIRQLLYTVGSRLTTWSDEHVMQGFRPSTAPQIDSEQTHA